MTLPETTAPGSMRVSAKGYGSGKYYVYADAAPEHVGMVERALIRAAKVCIRFDDATFRAALRDAGVPDPQVEQYLDSVSVIDDVYGVGKNPSGYY